MGVGVYEGVDGYGGEELSPPSRYALRGAGGRTGEQESGCGNADREGSAQSRFDPNPREKHCHPGVLPLSAGRSAAALAEAEASAKVDVLGPF